MITKERLLEIFKTHSFDSKLAETMDCKIEILKLLRFKIPFKVQKSIIGRSDEDIICLCDIETALPFINENDAIRLAELGLRIRVLDSIYKPEYFVMD